MSVGFFLIIKFILSSITFLATINNSLFKYDALTIHLYGLHYKQEEFWKFYIVFLFQ